MRTIEEFIKERKYLLNVSPKTLIFYQCSFKAFEGALDFEEAKRRVCELRERGVKAVSINTYLTCINAYWKWDGAGIKLPYLKEEERIIQTLSPNAINMLINNRPTKGTNLIRAWMFAICVLDTGIRASEAISLKRETVDFENLILRIKGKGGKERLVPFSLELRKLLFKFLHSSVNKTADYVFSTKSGSAISIRNIERDLKILGKRIGISGVRFSPHTLRHSFATSYLRNGGNLFYLSKILGHSDISITQTYLKSLGIDDLSNSHQRFSPLSQHSR